MHKKIPKTKLKILKLYLWKSQRTVNKAQAFNGAFSDTNFPL
jgi:hypothetical protein